MTRTLVYFSVYNGIAHFFSVPVTLMLIMLLFSPPSFSHQYLPLSDESAGLMVLDPAGVTQLEMFVGTASWTSLITFHTDEPSNSQFKVMDSYSKNCSLFGEIRGKPTPEGYGGGNTLAFCHDFLF